MVVKALNSKKGSTLVLVLIVIAMLSVLATSYISSAYYNFLITKNVMDSDTAYISAEAVTQKWFSIIEDKLTNSNYAIGTKLDTSNFGKYVLDNVQAIRKAGPTNGWSDIVKIVGESNNYAVEFARFELYDGGLETIAGKLYVRANVGITSFASQETSTYYGKNKRVYSYRSILVPVSMPIKLYSALYSVGDILVIGDGTATIKGNVYSYGSFPSSLRTPNQYLYGGVMAIDNAKLDVLGNIYTRSFVRTGNYKVLGTPSTARIQVTRDIFAQSIQTMQSGTSIIGYRNAYALDDLECNSENSIIGINGSFIGLNKAGAGASFHDQSSAVVNTSALHNKNLAPSNSRIAINGDVIAPGTGWKIDSTGAGIMQIESVGLLYPENNGSSLTSLIAAYKYEDLIKASDPVAPGTLNSVNYKRFLNDVTNWKRGYVTLVQAFRVNQGSTANQFPKIDDINHANITNWMTAIGSMIPNTPVDYANNFGNVGLPTRPSVVTGFASDVTNVFGANDALYFNPNAETQPNIWTSGVPANRKFNLSALKYLNPNEIIKNPIGGATYQMDTRFEIDGFSASNIELVYKYTSTLPGGPLDAVRLVDDSSDIATTVGGNVMHTNNIKLVEIGENPNAPIYNDIKPKVKAFWKNYWEPRKITSWGDYYNYYIKSIGGYAPINANASRAAYNEYEQMLVDQGDTDAHTDPANYHSRLDVLKSLVETRLNGFATRSYPTAAGATDWVVSVDGSMNEIIQKLTQLKLTLTDPSKIIINGPAVIPSNSGYRIYVCNNRQQITVGDFNGIIVTTARVRVMPGSTINGYILATGRHRTNTGVSTMDTTAGAPGLNKLDAADPGGAESTALVNGRCAGIIIDTGVAGTTTTIDAFCGEMDNALYTDETHDIFAEQMAREILLAKFRDEGIELSQIF